MSSDQTTAKRTVPQSVFDSQEARRVQRDAVAASIRDLDRIPRHMLDPGNPNHPNHDGLFGHDRHAFMAKQHRTTADK